jgi:hypothetical protein
MKGLKKITMVLMVLSMVVVFAGQAMGDYATLECEVLQAGYGYDLAGDSRVEIYLKPLLKPKAKMFYATSAKTSTEMNRMLAVAISAISNGWTVWAEIDYKAVPEAPEKEILQLRIIAPTSP